MLYKDIVFLLNTQNSFFYSPLAMSSTLLDEDDRNTDKGWTYVDQIQESRSPSSTPGARLQNRFFLRKNSTSTTTSSIPMWVYKSIESDEKKSLSLSSSPSSPPSSLSSSTLSAITLMEDLYLKEYLKLTFRQKREIYEKYK
jgi:hypothetical protein